MRVGQRLFLAVLPAIVGLFTVVALVYFGEYSREAPEWLVLLAVIAALGSAVLAWLNARYIARRILQLAEQREGRASSDSAVRRASDLLGAALRPRASAAGEVDELDRIEHVLMQLTDALAQERALRAQHEEALAARAREYTALVTEAVDGALRQLEEVRLPLHILLENRFGELNENQEEMLGAARSAAEASDAVMLRLRDVVRLDAGTLPLRSERVRVQELVAAILPPLRALAGEREVAIDADLPPTLPTLHGDRGRLQDALSTLLFEAVRGAVPRSVVTLGATGDRTTVQLSVRGGGPLPSNDAVALARRVVRGHGGVVEEAGDTVVVRLPVREG